MGLWCYVQTFSSHHGRALHCGGFSCCGVQARGHEGLSASWRKGSSQTRDRTDVPCISRRMILTQWTTREVLQLTPYLKSLHCTQALRGTPPGRPCTDSSWPLWPPHLPCSWNASAPSLPSWDAPIQFQGHSLGLGRGPRCLLESSDRMPGQCPSHLKRAQQAVLFLALGLPAALGSICVQNRTHGTARGKSLESWEMLSPRDTQPADRREPKDRAQVLGPQRTISNTLPSIPPLCNDARCVFSTESISWIFLSNRKSLRRLIHWEARNRTVLAFQFILALFSFPFQFFSVIIQPPQAHNSTLETVSVSKRRRKNLDLATGKHLSANY